MVSGKYLLEFVVFIVGAAVMMLELTGSRVLAPYLGTSIIVWTSLIGIILGSLSLGYWWGGKIADRSPNFKALSLIIFAGAIATAITAFSKSIVLNLIQDNINDLRVGSVVATSILFAPPSVLLGMVSPYAARLKIKNLKKSGFAVGSIYAVSTVGSIVGTFLTGFWLIAFLGNTKILILVSFLLILISILSFAKQFLQIKLIMLILLILSVYAVEGIRSLNRQQGFVDVDTLYNRVLVYDSVDQKTQKPIKALLIDPFTTQSAVFKDSDELVFNYLKFFRLAKHFKKDIKNSLLIGGAGYAYPRDYLVKYPDAAIDVVEIDPGLTELAMNYFRLKDDPRMIIYHQDARTFLNKTDKKYDVVFLDAFSSSYSVPYYLTTKETVARIYQLLNDDGVLVMNMISAIEGSKGKFLRAEYHTYKSLFENVYLYPVQDPQSPFEVQNIILVAAKGKVGILPVSDDPEIFQYLSHLWTKDIDKDVGILSDDWAPVDQYMIELL